MPARRALATAFVLEELHEVQRHVPSVVLVRKDDDGMGTDEAAVVLKRAKIERQITQVGRQYAAGSAARSKPRHRTQLR